MPTTQRKTRLDLAIWVLIFGGLFAIAFGIASRPVAEAVGWSLLLGGSSATATGVVLIWVRSRLGPDN